MGRKMLFIAEKNVVLMRRMLKKLTKINYQCVFVSRYYNHYYFRNQHVNDGLAKK